MKLARRNNKIKKEIKKLNLLFTKEKLKDLKRKNEISPMKKECPEIVTENVRVYLEMSGKCLSFDPKNDQIFRPNFF